MWLTLTSGNVNVLDAEQNVLVGPKKVINGIGFLKTSLCGVSTNIEFYKMVLKWIFVQKCPSLGVSVTVVVDGQLRPRETQRHLGPALTGPF